MINDWRDSNARGEMSFIDILHALHRDVITVPALEPAVRQIDVASFLINCATAKLSCFSLIASSA